MSIKELVEKCISNNDSAWSEFVKLYKNHVHRSVYCRLNKMNMCFANDSIKDIAQDVFVAIWEKNKLSTIRDVGCLKSWLGVVSINVTSDYYRKRAKKVARETRLDENLFSGLSITSRVNIPYNKLDARQLIEQAEIHALLKNEVDKLRRAERMVLKLSIYEENKYKDIADIMNMPIGTISVLIKRAKDKVRKGLKKYLFKVTIKDKERFG